MAIEIIKEITIGGVLSHCYENDSSVGNAIKQNYNSFIIDGLNKQNAYGMVINNQSWDNTNLFVRQVSYGITNRPNEKMLAISNSQFWFGKRSQDNDITFSWFEASTTKALRVNRSDDLIFPVFAIDTVNQTGALFAVNINTNGGVDNTVAIDRVGNATHEKYLALTGALPIEYVWQSVPSISGKNGILSLSQIKASAINDGDPVSGASASDFDVLTANAQDLINNVIQDLTKVTVEYTIPQATYSYIKLVYKKDNIPADITDGTAIDITQSSTSQVVSGIADGGTYWFVIFTDKTISEPKMFKTEYINILTESQRDLRNWDAGVDKDRWLNNVTYDNGINAVTFTSNDVTYDEMLRLKSVDFKPNTSYRFGVKFKSNGFGWITQQTFDHWFGLTIFTDDSTPQASLNSQYDWSISFSNEPLDDFIEYSMQIDTGSHIPSYLGIGFYLIEWNIQHTFYFKDIYLIEM